MPRALAHRELILAGVGLLSVVLALALASVLDEPAARTEPASVPVPGSGWYEALAAPYRFKARTKRTACGLAAGPRTLGVAHAVLPCGAKVVIEYGGRKVLTQVVDRGSGAPGREFDVTAPLARALGLRGIQQVRWRFARG